MSAVHTGARGRSVPRALFLGLRSTIVIGAVVFAVTAARSNRFRLADAMVLLAEYWGYLSVIFIVLSIWNYWVSTSTRLRTTAESRVEK